MSVYENNSTGARLNTSNIAVPSAATMVQHLLDSDPHPQYLLATELSSAVSATINLGDLADVKFGLGVTKDHLIIYNGTCWTNTPASAIISSMGIPASVSSSLVTLSSGVSLNSSVLTSNIENISTIFRGTVELVEEKVTMAQTDPSVECSAIVSGHILTAYDPNGVRINTIEASYNSGVTTLCANFSAVHSEQWTVVHSVPISTVITSNVISKIASV